MRKFEVTIVRTYKYYTEVEADSQSEAEQIASDNLTRDIGHVDGVPITTITTIDNAGEISEVEG